MQENENKKENAKELPRLNIPKQDFKNNRQAFRPFLDDAIVKDLREVFDLFSETGKVNPHNMKNALRSVKSPKIYKLIEDLCLNYDNNNEQPINFNQFISFLNERLGDNTTRIGINNAFSKIMDPKIKEITPEALHKITSELGDELSLDDINYLLTKISEPSTDINITSDEFYYIMTKKPADVDLITPVTKSTK